MADIIRLEDLKAEEIDHLLNSNGHRLAADQAAVIQRSADQICRLKRAFDAFPSLIVERNSFRSCRGKRNEFRSTIRDPTGQTLPRAV